MADGEGVEVGLTGREGVVGGWLAFPDVRASHDFIVQIAGTALVMDAGAFAAQLQSDQALSNAVLRWMQAGMNAMAQFTGCNRLHPVNERYARWLLMAHDRVQGDGFHLTQEYASQMLGVRRASVTLVAGELSSAGLISYHRGDVKIADREGLEDAACECYGAVNDEAQRLLGYDVRKNTTTRAKPPLHGDGEVQLHR
jgi:CRP-like cAMP-binding protein